MKKLMQYTLSMSMLIMLIDLTACQEIAQDSYSQEVEIVNTVLADGEWQEALNKNGELSFCDENNLQNETTVQVLSLKNN